MATPGPRGVLVVEDESIVAQDLQQRLADLGFDAFATAASAEEALARAEGRRPDVALVDIHLKGRLDGIKAAQLLQERFGVTIVYLTGITDEATRQRALRTHPQGFLIKPVRLAELRSAIEIALWNRAGERAEASEAALAQTSGPPAVTRHVRAPGSRAVRREVERILGSEDFDAPRRSREFLRFVVEESLAGRGDAISQDAIATEVFGRKDDFDAMVDPIVRIQAGRLRRSLERYYLLSGKEDPVRIELPRGTYVPVFGGVAVEATAPLGETRSAAGNHGSASRADEGWPSVVVNGFEVLAPDPQLWDVALEMDEELALELGRYRAIRLLRRRDLVARDPGAPRSARFVLDGRLRRDGQGLRITARLVDGTTGEQIWGDEYHTVPRPQQWSGSPADVSRVIAARVAADEGIVVQTLAAERRRRRPVHPAPYDAILLAYEFFLARDPETLGPAVAALRHVVDTAPECGPAWTRLARLYCNNYSFEATAIPTPIDEAISFAHRGVRVDPESRIARWVLAACLLVKGELAAGRDELEQALQSSPGSLAYLEMIGLLLTLMGDWERGQALSRSARERNPHCLPHVLFGTWADGLRRGDFEHAYAAALEYRDPTFFWRTVMRASSLGLLGRGSEARADLADLLSRKPDFRARGRLLLGHYVKFPEVMDRTVEGLARAGLVLD